VAVGLYAPERRVGSLPPVIATRRIAEVEPRHGSVTIAGSVPLPELFGFSVLLRSLTDGRGTCVLQPAGFRPLARRKGA
jgi:elongation factor G